MDDSVWVIIEYSPDFESLAKREAKIAQNFGIDVTLRKIKGAKRQFRIFSDWGIKGDISDVIKYIKK